MSDKEILEKASDPVGGGATGVSQSADPVATKAAKRPQDKEEGEKVAPGTGDAEKVTPQMGSDANAADSIKTKTMKEEISELFGDDLSEDFKEKASVIFEAAVHAKLQERKTQLEEEYATKAQQLEEEVVEKFADAIESYKSELSEQVDTYMNYVVDEWMKQNEVAVESSLNAQIAEEFMGKLKSLFEESYITVPESKTDLVEEMAAKIEELEEKLNSSILTNIELQSVVEQSQQKDIFAEVSEGLALTQVEKFRTLAESVEFDTVENYRKKLDIVKSQYFSEKKVVATPIVEQVDEQMLNEEVSAKPATGPVSGYVTAISRTIKK
jgi:hypothetical protein